ncbi:MAG: hypothetical protein J6Z01_05615 [Bacteroidales bacterium]|nr:hypothetical protein [Bacteroidales bacterium]
MEIPENTKHRVIRVRVFVDVDNDEAKQYNFHRDTVFVVPESEFTKTIYGIIQNIKQIHKKNARTTKTNR